MSKRILIHKVQGLESHFTILANVDLQRTDLSYEASGLLGYLLSLPLDWVIQPDALKREGKAGRDKIARMLKELIATGYIHVEQSRTDDNKYGDNIYSVYGTPTDNPFYDQSTEKQSTGKQLTGNLQLQSKQKSSNKVKKTPKQRKINPPNPPDKIDRQRCILLIGQMMYGGHRGVEPTKQMFGHAARILGGLAELKPPPDDKELDALFEWHARVHSTMNFPRKIPAFQQIILDYRKQNPVLAEPKETRHTENTEDTSLDKYLDKFLASREGKNDDK